jgi:hypothetical protein
LSASDGANASTRNNTCGWHGNPTPLDRSPCIYRLALHTQPAHGALLRRNELNRGDITKVVANKSNGGLAMVAGIHRSADAAYLGYVTDIVSHSARYPDLTKARSSKNDSS